MRRFARPGCFAILCVAALALCPVRAGASKAKPDEPIAGEGLIYRVISNGVEPVFSADGYQFRISAKTELHLNKRLVKLGDVSTGMWARFEGQPDTTGTIVAAKAWFTKFKEFTRKPNPLNVQITMFPPDSKIDAFQGFAAGEKEFPPDDEGGWCGWYPVIRDDALQEHIRQVGMALVPKYQRDLDDNDSGKIHFRFYAVEGTTLHKVIFCGGGLILLPMAALERLHGDSELAAVLAEGVAAEMAAGLILIPSVENTLEGLAMAALSTGLVPAMAAGAAVDAVIAVKESRKKEARDTDRRRMEHSRARMALALMADAGYDPHQAAEAWRLLRPIDPPKDPTKVKDSEHSRYIREFLAAQEAAKSPNAPAQEAGEAATSAPDTKAKQ